MPHKRRSNEIKRSILQSSQVHQSRSR